MSANGVAPTPPTEAPAVAAPTPIAPADPLSFVDDAPEFPEKTRAALAVPVDPKLVEVRQPNDLLYVPWVHYQAVLFAAFGPGGYRLVPRSVPRQQGNVMTWMGALFVRPPGTSKFQFIKEATGECGLHGGMTAGNAAEGAQSDCLVKCCKGLGIFMELFDPSWRRAWQDKYLTTHKAAKQKAAWPAARPAPATPASASAGSSTAAPTGPAGSSAAPVEAPAPTPPPEAAATPDTGEAATDEQKAALRAEVRRHKWTSKYARLWLDQRFGVPTPDGLTQRQAAAAMVLILGWKGPVAS
jgi:hypothetical protein